MTSHGVQLKLIASIDPNTEMASQLVALETYHMQSANFNTNNKGQVDLLVMLNHASDISTTSHLQPNSLLTRVM